jgi:glycosyltransferase involved in cell wall biosynthesis
MNIGIDIRPLMVLNRTGVGEYTFELLNALLNIDKNNQYFLFYNCKKNIDTDIRIWEQSNVHYINTSWPNKIFNFSQKLFSYPKIDNVIIKNNNIDKLDVFYSPNINFASLDKNTKQILTIHDLSFEMYPQYYSLKRRAWHKLIDVKKQCQKAELILTPSYNTKRDVIKYFQIDNNKIDVLYPGLSSKFQNMNNQKIDDEKTREKYNLPNKYILYLGTIEPRKNIAGLIKAYEQISSSLTTEHSLVIAGSSGWKNKDIYQKVKNSKYKNRIKFIGYVAEEDKPNLYSLASIFVYTSFYEGFGFPILEAMSCQTPVITSNRSSLPEISEQAAYLINPNRENELANAIKIMIENNRLREYYINNGLEQIKKFNWQKTAEKFLKTISNI